MSFMQQLTPGTCATRTKGYAPAGPRRRIACRFNYYCIILHLFTHIAPCFPDILCALIGKVRIFPTRRDTS